MTETDPSLEIDLILPSRLSSVSKKLHKLAVVTAEEELSSLTKKRRGFSGKNYVINIQVITDAKIKKLNKKYLGKDRPTDVISFSYMDEPMAVTDKESEESLFVLGDVAVSFETAASRCRTFKNSFKKELALYIIHGILHVFGYDDRAPAPRRKMEKKQDYHLKKFKKIMCER